MKCISILTPVLIITLLLSACGARAVQATPPPTVNVVDLQNTMAAAAFTMVAATQAAIPTATPPPPTAAFTDTPPPTNTFLPLPTDVTFTPAANGESGGNDPCINQVLPATLKGEPVKIRVDNSTKVTVSLTVYLNSTEPGGQCGYRSYSLPPGEFVVVNNLVEGCYTLWAWNPDPENYFIVTNGTNCVDSADTWIFDISTGSIQLKS